jgi:guanylate kinase
MFILSAPSGAGKTTLCRALQQRFPDLAYSISYTTRSPRTNEVDGIDYFFVTDDVFTQGIANERWAEYAIVHGNYYGTSADWITETLAAGSDILLDIDVQGASQITKRFPDAITIFIMPPSTDELSRRLTKRGTEDSVDFNTRLANAQEEMRHKDAYRHILINDDLDIAIKHLIEIVDGYRRGKCRPKSLSS